ncbi:type II toxin-antitoxin system Phd/YefM family antitoxin [Schumannella luteola]
MSSVGLRELKQNPSGVIARAEAGETITVTVQGRPAALITPLAPRRKRWVSAEELSAALASIPPDTTGWYEEWYESRNDDPIEDPWERRR